MRREEPFECVLKSQYAAVHFAASLVERGYTFTTDGRLGRGMFSFSRCREGWVFRWLERLEDDRIEAYHQ